MSDRTGTVLTIDYAALERDLDAVGLVALPRAAAAMLNGAAFAAQRRLTSTVDDVFDRPKAYTRSAFLVVKAKRAEGREMASQVHAKQDQAAYLRLQIEGGQRGPDDVGVSSRADVMTYASRQDAYGNIAKGAVARLAKENKREKARRAAFASRRAAAASAYRTRVERTQAQITKGEAASTRAAARAKTAEMKLISGTGDLDQRIQRSERARTSSQTAALRLGRHRERLAAMAAPKAATERYGNKYAHTPGLFFGTVKGRRGYWRRPERTTMDGQPRRRGVRQVQNLGKLELLLRVKDRASYKPRFPYNKVIADSYAEYGAPAEFSRELDRAIRIELERASQRGRSRSTSGPRWRRPAFLADR